MLSITTVEINTEVLKIINKIRIRYDPTIPLLGQYTQRNLSEHTTEIPTHLCLLWCHSLQPSFRIGTNVHQEMNDKGNVLSSLKWMKLYLPFAENWVELKITMLNEISQTWAAITHLVSLSSAQPSSTGKKKKFSDRRGCHQHSDDRRVSVGFVS